MSTKLLNKADDNLKVAVYSESNNFYDCAVSRYYYYLYQNIIVYVSQNVVGYSSVNTQNSHSDTIDEFIKSIKNRYNLNYAEIFKIQLIQQLRTQRNKSDYHDRELKTQFVFKRCFKDNYDTVTSFLKAKAVI